MSDRQLPTRAQAARAMTVGGAGIFVLGVWALVDADNAGSAWFASAGVAALLLAVGLLGASRSAPPATARRALAAAAAAMAVFGLSHFFALVDEGPALVLFSVFMVLAAIALIVAGVAALRHSDVAQRESWVLLACGVWPILTIPAASAIGDVPHFAAIAIWGACWVALGLGLRGSTTTSSTAGGQRGRVRAQSR